MITNHHRYRTWTQDRFLVFLVLATGLHVLLFFAISFGISLQPVPRLANTLDVVLVQWRSEDEPEQADYLAQASQRGGGETEERSRPSEPVSAEIPAPTDGSDLRQAARKWPGVDLLGPAPAALPRLVGRWRFQLVIRGAEVHTPFPVAT